MEKECCVCFTESGVKLNRVLHQSMSIERKLIENIDSDIEIISEKKDGPDDEGSPNWPVIVNDNEHVKASYITLRRNRTVKLSNVTLMMMESSKKHLSSRPH